MKNKNLLIPIKKIDIKKIDIKKIDKYHFFNSLIENARDMELLTEKDLMYIYNGLSECLRELILRRTGGQSTSLTNDETKDLFSSIIYSLDTYFESLNTIEEGIEQLKTCPINELFERGTLKIQDMYNEVKDLYFYIEKNKIKINLDCYNSTISIAIPTFLKSYDIVFGSHITSTSIDYPLSNDDWSINGVKYMHKYLNTLILETTFCNMFDHSKVKELLIFYGKKVKANYQYELINIFELILYNSIFLLIAEKDVRELLLSIEDEKVIFDKVKKVKSSNLNQFIISKVHYLFQVLDIKNESLKKYILKSLNNFIARFKNNITSESLNSMYITKINTTNVNTTLFQDQTGMQESEFLKFCNKIQKFEDVNEKINCILSDINSINDFIDLLNLDIFYTDEYFLLYNRLGIYELGFLTKFTFYEELRDRKGSLQNIIKQDNYYDYEWQSYLVNFLKDQNQSTLNDLEEIVDTIVYNQLEFF